MIITNITRIAYHEGELPDDFGISDSSLSGLVGPFSPWLGCVEAIQHRLSLTKLLAFRQIILGTYRALGLFTIYSSSRSMHFPANKLPRINPVTTKQMF